MAAAAVTPAVRLTTALMSPSIGPRKIPKTDTHVHLFDLQQLQYSWLKNAPEINRDFSLQDYRLATAKANIGKMLFMESGADSGLGVKEASWVNQLFAQEPRLKGIIAKLDLRLGKQIEPDLQKLLELGSVKGIRSSFPGDAANSQDFLASMTLLKNADFDLRSTAESRLVGRCGPIGRQMSEQPIHPRPSR